MDLPCLGPGHPRTLAGFADCPGIIAFVSVLAVALLASAVQADPAERIVERFRNRWRQDANLACSVRVKLPSGEVATGRLEWQRPSRLRFVVQTPRDRGEFRQIGGESLEVNHNLRQYLTQGGLPELVPPPGYASELAEVAFPYVMNVGNLRGIVNVGLNFKVQPPAKIDGATCDVVRSESDQVKVTAWIDRVGRLRRLATWFRTPAGVIEEQTDFSGYGKPAPDLASMDVIPPLGYTPYFLPILYFPVAIGQKLDIADWPALDRAKLGPRGLVLVADGANAPDRAMRQWLMEEGLPFVERGPETRFGKRASVAGTPVLILLDASGKVERLWFGFHRSGSSELGRDVRAAIGD